MGKNSRQTKEWAGSFGREYTLRNTRSLEEMEALYERTYGRTRSAINEAFLAGIDTSSSVLEVGSNIGSQLRCLRERGFARLTGLELQWEAADLSRKMVPGIDVVQGSALDIPFRDGSFDVVFTSGVLIHIGPADLGAVMRGIHRCTRKFIWGFEYYSDRHSEIPYRGHNELLWKGDFLKIYLELFGDLRKVREERFPYLENDNVDSMVLVEKG